MIYSGKISEIESMKRQTHTNKTLIFSVIFLLILGQINFAQTETPLTLAQILTGLQSQSSGLTLVQKNTKIIGDIKKRGVSFTLIPQIESSLRESGASDALIQAIREKTSSGQTSDKIKIVSADFWNKQRAKAVEDRNEPVGNEVEEIVVPEQLRGGISKQSKKLREMREAGFEMPLDFPDLAKKVLKGELIILPSATDTYVIEVGGSATRNEFTEFIFEKGNKTLTAKSEKAEALRKIAQLLNNLDLTKPDDRLELRKFLLMTIQPSAKTVLEEIAAAYFQKFNRPLIIIALNRSIDYQLDLNKTNPNSFIVRNADSTPPHTSGLAFDISYKFMTAGEQEFVMEKIAEMESAGTVHASRETGLSPVYHLFVLGENKSYAAMSESEKLQFISTKANELLDKFGRTTGDEIPDAGLRSIKQHIDAYISRNNVKPTNQSCRFGQNITQVLTRGSEYSPMINKSFAAKNLVPEIGIYIAMIESEFCPCLQSPTGALGMFQLMKHQGLEENLNIKDDASPENPDDRCTPDLAVDVAASLMNDYIDHTRIRLGEDYRKNSLGTTLAIASYNSGQGSMSNNVKKIQTGKSKVSFWDLMANSEKMSKQFQTENIKYVPKFFAAAIIGENPQAFEISGVQPLSTIK